MVSVLQIQHKTIVWRKQWNILQFQYRIIEMHKWQSTYSAKL